MSVSYQTITGKLSPLPTDILVVGMDQGDKLTSGGLIILDDSSVSTNDQQAKDGKGVRPRWAQVYKVGSLIDDSVQEGKWILIEHGRWTYAIDVIDEHGTEVKVQKIDPDCIYGFSDTCPA